MKIIVALNNKKIKEELESIYHEKVYKYDICDKENVIELLEKDKEEDIVLITKDSLNGNLTGRQYARQIRNVNPYVRVIYIVEKLDTQYKKFLFSNEIINIIEGSIVEIDNIVEIIDTKKFIIYKNVGKAAEMHLEKNKSNLIAVFGGSGAGKSVISSIIAKKIAKVKSYKLSLIDMNTQNPSIDIINNLDYKLSGNENTDMLVAEEGEIYQNNIKQLSYVTGNINLIETENRRLSSIYNRVLEKSSIDKDISILDLSSNPFDEIVKFGLTKADKVLFVVNPNYISVRQAIKYLDIITNLYNIPTENIGIIINKITESSLSNIQLKTLLKGYRIVMFVDYEKKIEGVINGEYENIFIKSSFKNLYEFLDLKIPNESIKSDIIKNLLVRTNNY